MSKHAFLSALSSHRWLECPPSVKLCAGHEDRASPYAKQGTDCHELCVYLVEKALGKDVKDPTENLDYYDTEMQDCAESYCSYVLEQIEEALSKSTGPDRTATGFLTMGGKRIWYRQLCDCCRWCTPYL